MKKKFLMTLLGVVSTVAFSLSGMFTALAVTPQADKIVVNGDFEASQNFVSYNEDALHEDLVAKWRPVSGNGTLALNNDPFAGEHALDLTLRDSGGDSGVIYRIPTTAMENDTYYFFGAKVKAKVPSVSNHDGVYVGFVPVIKLSNGEMLEWEPFNDLDAFYANCSVAESYPLNGWQTLSGIIKHNYDATNGVYTYEINGFKNVVDNVAELYGYDLYFIFSSGDLSNNYVVNIDNVDVREAIGYTGIDLGNDQSNILPNGDFEVATSIRHNHVTFGSWSTTSTTGHVEQNNDYAKNGMSSMEVEFENLHTLVSARIEQYAGVEFKKLTKYSFSNLQPEVMHTIKGYIKSESVGTEFSVNLMPTIFKGGFWSDSTSSGGNMLIPIASYTVKDTDRLDGEWIELTGTFYYKVDCAKQKIEVWINSDPSTNPYPTKTFRDVYEFHALDIAFSAMPSVENTEPVVAYYDMWSLYSVYNASVNVLGDNGENVTDKTLVLKDFFGNDVTDNYDITIKDGYYNINNVYGPLKVSILGDDSFPAQTVDSLHTFRIVQKPYSYTISVKNYLDETMTKDSLQLMVRQEGNSVGSIVWNDDDSFTINGLTGKDITVTIIAEGYKNGNVTISSAGSETVTLQQGLKPTFSAIVMVKDSENKPINNATVKIKQGNNLLAIATAGRNGTYSLSGINDNVPGDIIVEVILDGYTFETGKTITRQSSTVIITGVKTGNTDNGNDTQKTGCGGNVLSSSIVLSTVCLMSVLVVLLKNVMKNNL